MDPKSHPRALILNDASRSSLVRRNPYQVPALLPSDANSFPHSRTNRRGLSLSWSESILIIIQCRMDSPLGGRQTNGLLRL
jgi:hypothetical protein